MSLPMMSLPMISLKTLLLITTWSSNDAVMGDPTDPIHTTCKIPFLVKKSAERLVHKNRPYFENSGPNRSELGSFVDEHHILYAIDLIFG